MHVHVCNLEFAAGVLQLSDGDEAVVAIVAVGSAEEAEDRPDLLQSGRQDESRRGDEREEFIQNIHHA